MKINNILSLLLFGIAKAYTPNSDKTSQEKLDTDSADKVKSDTDEYGYDPRVLGMGSLAEMFDQYGAIPNEYNLNEDEFLANR